MEEFFKNVSFQENGCWLWTGKTWANDRYGVITRLPKPNKSVSAHRMAYAMFKGIPAGMLVCHTCDVPLCVNPSHLFLGTPSDNMKDAVSKGRLKGFIDNSQKDQRGSNNGRAKLTLAKADEIRAYAEENNASCKTITEVFGLKSTGHAHAIVTRKIWNY